MELYNVATKYPTIQLHIPTIKRYVLMVEYSVNSDYEADNEWHICGVFTTLKKAKEAGPQLEWKFDDSVWYTCDVYSSVFWSILETVEDMFIFPTNAYLLSRVDILPWDILKHRYMGDNK